MRSTFIDSPCTARCRALGAATCEPAVRRVPFQGLRPISWVRAVFGWRWISSMPRLGLQCRAPRSSPFRSGDEHAIMLLRGAATERPARPLFGTYAKDCSRFVHYAASRAKNVVQDSSLARSQAAAGWGAASGASFIGKLITAAASASAISAYHIQVKLPLLTRAIPPSQAPKKPPIWCDNMVMP